MPSPGMRRIGTVPNGRRGVPGPFGSGLRGVHLVLRLRHNSQRCRRGIPHARRGRSGPLALALPSFPRVRVAFRATLRVGVPSPGPSPGVVPADCPPAVRARVAACAFRRHGGYRRGIAAAALMALCSLWLRAEALGDNGVLPASGFLEAVHATFESGSYWTVPTLLWFGMSFHWVFALGTLCALVDWQGSRRSGVGGSHGTRVPLRDAAVADVAGTVRSRGPNTRPGPTTWCSGRWTPNPRCSTGSTIRSTASDPASCASFLSVRVHRTDRYGCSCGRHG